MAVAFCAIVSLSLLAVPAAAVPKDEPPPVFDLDNGNAVAQVVFPALQQAQGATISADGSDVTLIVDHAMLLELAWFDAIAPFHAKAVGIFSNLGRRPSSENTNRNKNTAVIYASYRILNKLIPEFSAEWRTMVKSAGLDPDDGQENTDTAIGLGNLAARRALEARNKDGMNRFGDEGGARYNAQPYADYTGYVPVNTAYALRNPSRWQPNILSNKNGIFTVQQFATPQMRLNKPITYDDPSRFELAPPRDSDHRRLAAYRRQADEVLAASAGLTDAQKMTAEMFNDKFLSIGFAATGTAIGQKGLDIEQTVHFVATIEIAIFDVTIAVWHQKARYDAVRPFSAIRYLYGDKRLRAWGGPGKGTVDDITGKEWRGYLNTANHPEYPSGSAGLCQAYAQAARRFFGTDAIQIAVPFPAGSSRVEPGVTPARDLTLSWSTWTDFARDCGMSRLWGGVHFRASIESMNGFAPQFGERAHVFVQRKLNGDR
ncbi:MAG TPA: vanadium-dependent haloperoxidase [Streptosporangiaceae bacterium]|nr:vanadium-dependent haloperoxidase [Streptosporangiaceae bacterium]